ncbi:globin [Candidatus Methylacidiphilum fumarolicum]|uniref:Globin domain n=2 Tax=Candidatus Methylacidiphilum fumarolicum TaxID=591154 RepID=I0JX54_METFB|nr:protoglobin domain-containing protein [Candidatus Methylacidiphilum fumarolicum]MBW6415701.1 globin [Candidatus Methylacidiphilum fumarolicum]TFE67543.1 globin [Candidatus Methylacidiphilum fumarolicum]TFE71605.1 globin [Candidatus Methylacidiphilum fumarolicum]TFE73613.1 globin [Candidatus Methylacidiphilum fumarolicum]TFE75322.1 globin [Candidatus Methylacidiphilum fumarolicum]
MHANIVAVTQLILEQMPESCRFNKEDGEKLLSLRPYLYPLEDKLVKGFYDLLYNHPPTASIFDPTERENREWTLRNWWRRTLDGPFDLQYWTWQAAVGIIHIRRKVKNPMMIGMWGWILNFIGKEISNYLSYNEFLSATEVLHRLAATAQALTAESYLHHYLIALSQATGTETQLLDRLVLIELDQIQEFLSQRR